MISLVGEPDSFKYFGPLILNILMHEGHVYNMPSVFDGRERRFEQLNPTVRLSNLKQLIAFCGQKPGNLARFGGGLSAMQYLYTVSSMGVLERHEFTDDHPGWRHPVCLLHTLKCFQFSTLDIYLHHVDSRHPAFANVIVYGN